MEYEGKLFGKVGRKYFDTGKTSYDWDKLKKQADEAKILRVMYNNQLALNKIKVEISIALNQKNSDKKDCEKALVLMERQMKLELEVVKLEQLWETNYSRKEGEL